MVDEILELAEKVKLEQPEKYAAVKVWETAPGQICFLLKTPRRAGRLRTPSSGVERSLLLRGRALLAAAFLERLLCRLFADLLRFLLTLHASSVSQTGSAVGVLRRAVVGERLARARDERLDRVGEVDPVDVVVAALDAQPVRLEQHVGVGVAGRRLEAVGGELDQQPERVVK